MPWKWNTIFCRIFKNIWHWDHTRGTHHMATRVQGAPPASWAPRGPPPLIPAPTHCVFLQKNPPIAQTRVLAHLVAIFDLLAQSSIHKTVLEDCFSRKWWRGCWGALRAEARRISRMRRTKSPNTIFLAPRRSGRVNGLVMRSWRLPEFTRLLLLGSECRPHRLPPWPARTVSLTHQYFCAKFSFPC